MVIESETQQSPRRSGIRAGWRGEATLAWVYWGFGFGGGLLLLAIGSFGFLLLLPYTANEGQSVLVSPIFRAYLLIFAVIYAAYVVASAVMIWRCSFNVSWRGWGYLARAAVVVWLLRLLLFIRTLVVG